MKTRNSISPYPPDVSVDKAGQVFRDDAAGKPVYLGYVDKVANWGTDYLARPHTSGGRALTASNRFFKTRTEAVRHILSVYETEQVRLYGVHSDTPAEFRA